MEKDLIRHAEPGDYEQVIAVVDEWWGGRPLAALLPRLFFVHFRETSFVAERGGELTGFLAGFLSQTFRDEAYIHFVGVHPRSRREGLGRRLYERFFEVVRGEGRRLVRSVTSPANKTSVAFHLGLGFQLEPQPATEDGLPVFVNYDGRGGSRVLFVKTLG